MQFPFSSESARQAMLWLLHRAGGQMDKMKLVKLVFLADYHHLRRYGRPVAGGHYFALPYGPISSELLDEINKPAPESGFDLRDNRRVIALAPTDEDPLSESDIEVLELVWRRYGKMDTFRLSDLTHEMELWKKHEIQEGRAPISYEDFFEEEIDEESQAVRELAQDEYAIRRFLEVD